MKRIITSLVLLAALSLPSWAQTDDPNIARADKMFGFVQADLADSLYANMADEVLDMVKKENLEGVFAKTEIMAGKYKSRDPWEKNDRAWHSFLRFDDALRARRAGAAHCFQRHGKDARHTDCAA